MATARRPLPSAPVADLDAGTAVRLAPDVTTFDRTLVAGGDPWRLLRLSGAALSRVERWREGARVRPGEEHFARTLVDRGLLVPTFDAPSTLDGVDIVVPVRDHAAAATHLVGQLGDLPVTVVDDGSVDPEPVAQVAAARSVRLVRLDPPRGAGGARNAGAAATTRDILWFIDADIDVADVAHVGSRLLAHFADPKVGAVAARVRGPAVAGWRQGFESRHSPLDMGAASRLVVPGARVGYVPAACLMVRRSAFGEGFDESLRTGEDVDFVWRLHDAGWLVRYDASVVVHHAARPTWSGWWRQRVSYGASGAPLALRHGGRVAPLRVDALTATAWAATLAGQSRAALAAVAAARQRIEAQLPASLEDRAAVANAVARRAIAGAGGPLARGAVRAYGPVLLATAVHPALRRASVVVLVAGTAWRWRGRERPHLRDLPLAVADDLAYAIGLWKGAVAERSVRALVPQVTALGRRPRAALESERT